MMEGIAFVMFCIVGTVIVILAAWLLNEAWEILRAVVRRRVKTVRYRGIKIL